MYAKVNNEDRNSIYQTLEKKGGSMEKIAIKIKGKIVGYIRGAVVKDRTNNSYFIKNDGRPVKRIYGDQIVKWVYEPK